MQWNWSRPTSSDGTARKISFATGYFRRVLDTNHGSAKEQVVNAERAKRQVVAQGRTQRLQQLAQACRARLSQLREQDEQLEAHILAYEQRRSELLIQVSQFEEAGRMEERSYFPVKVRQVAVDWEGRQNRTKLEKNALRKSRLMDKCEGYCRELRQVLRHQEEEVCHKVNEAALTLPDGRRLVVAVGKRMHARLDGPLAQTG